MQKNLDRRSPSTGPNQLLNFEVACTVINSMEMVATWMTAMQVLVAIAKPSSGMYKVPHMSFQHWISVDILRLVFATFKTQHDH